MGKTTRNPFFARVQRGLLGAIILFAVVAWGGVACAEEPTDNTRKGLFKRIFSNSETDQQRFPAPRKYDSRVHDVYMDRESDTVAARITPYEDGGASGGRSNDPVERYPHIPGYNSVRNCPQHEIEDVIDEIFAAYEGRIDKMDPPDLRKSALQKMAALPADFETVWKELVRCQIWEGQQTVERSIEDIYYLTLAHSNQVKVFSDIPLIRETGIQEADGEFDPVMFLDAGLIRRNEPNGSALTAQPGVNRFLEDEEFIEAGVRKKFFTGAEASVSNRWSQLSNNSGFLNPNNQGASELIISVTQPLLSGAGYHYNHSRIKIAKFDANMASAEFLRQLQAHLVEVNQAYWALFYARSAYLLSKQLVAETADILKQLESRSDLDALESEVLRARAALATRKSFLNRAEVAIRNSEERLRALVNDPRQDIGSNSETLPMTLPVLSGCLEDVRTVAKEALHNRPEIQQGFDQLRAAVVRRDMQKNEKWPTLNLVAELMLSEIQPNDRSNLAFRNQFDNSGYQLGLQFEQPLDNDEARARLLRRELELRQQTNQLKTTIDTVLLEAVVAYRELVTTYRDMQGKYETLNASREELRQLQERLEVDTGSSRTTSSQLQLILDSMERNQNAEVAFLDAVVSYNAAFASLERAKGTILRKQRIGIERVRGTDPSHQCDELEELKLTGSGDHISEACRYCGKVTFGDPSTCCDRSIESYSNLISPTMERRGSGDFDPIPNIPLEDLPSSDEELMPMKPVSEQARSIFSKPNRGAGGSQASEKPSVTANPVLN